MATALVVAHAAAESVQPDAPVRPGATPCHRRLDPKRPGCGILQIGPPPVGSLSFSTDVLSNPCAIRIFTGMVAGEIDRAVEEHVCTQV